MSVEGMGPLLGALGVAPLIASEAGFSAPFIFIVCWVAMFVVAITVARFSRALPVQSKSACSTTMRPRSRGKCSICSAPKATL